MDFHRSAPRVGAHIVIAGGCGGIGRELTAAALNVGLRVTVLDLGTSIAANPVAAGVRAFAFDALEEESIATAMDGAGHLAGSIDCLVNLVGFRNRIADFDQIPVQEWDRVISGNLRAAFLLCRFALPWLRKSIDPAIVHVASAMGVKAVRGHAPYASAKAGLLMLTQLMAMEIAPQIRVNAVAPSAVDTDFHRGGTGREGWTDSGSDASMFSTGVPMGRIALAHDIVGPILFLAGPHSGFVTGQTLIVNGGK